MKYDPEWMLAVLADAREFFDANEMPRSRDAIEVALVKAHEELTDLAKKKYRLREDVPITAC